MSPQKKNCLDNCIGKAVYFVLGMLTTCLVLSLKDFLIPTGITLSSLHALVVGNDSETQGEAAASSSDEAAASAKDSATQAPTIAASTKPPSAAVPLALRGPPQTQTAAASHSEAPQPQISNANEQTETPASPVAVASSSLFPKSLQLSPQVSSKWMKIPTATNSQRYAFKQTLLYYDRFRKHMSKTEAHVLKQVFKDMTVPPKWFIPGVYDLLALVLASETVVDNGLFLEFGVASGNSANISGNILKKRFPGGPHYYGFDTFTGLPQAWKGHMKKGQFAQKGGRPPPVDENVRLTKGLFSATLPGFLKQHPEPVAFVSIDCDLYSGSMDILRILRPRFRKGTIIHFHDFYHSKRELNPSEELRALYRFLVEDHWRMQLEYMKVRASGSIEPTIFRVLSI